MEKISKTLNFEKQGKGIYDKNGRRINKPQSPVFIRRSFFDKKISKTKAGYDQWKVNPDKNEEGCGFTLEDYVSSHSHNNKSRIKKKQTEYSEPSEAEGLSFIHPIVEKRFKILLS